MRIQAGFLIGLVFCLLSHGVLTGISYQLGPKVSYRCRLCCNVVKWSKQKWVEPALSFEMGLGQYYPFEFISEIQAAHVSQQHSQ